MALYRTALDPNDPELGRSKAFRSHFKNLLSSVRQNEVCGQAGTAPVRCGHGWPHASAAVAGVQVSWRELDLIIDIINKVVQHCL